MKTAKDPRHIKRIKMMQGLFSLGFAKISEGAEIENYEDIKQVVDVLDKVDTLIREAATSWPLEKINKVDLAILRLATFELISKADIPAKVIVDEAVELGKEYGGESSPSFVNGVLGKIITDLKERSA